MNLDATEIESWEKILEAELAERRVEREAAKTVAKAQASLAFAFGIMIGFFFGVAAGVWLFADFLERMIQ